MILLLLVVLCCCCVAPVVVGMVVVRTLPCRCISSSSWILLFRPGSR